MRTHNRLAKRRRGYGLIMTLVVVVVGSVLAASIFGLGNIFLRYSTNQRTFYTNHISVTDYIQDVKGRLVDENNRNQRVSHGRGVAAQGDPIDALDDLLIADQYQLNEIVPSARSQGTGRQRIVVSVYDVAYFFDQLTPALRSDVSAMKDFPAPINVIARASTSAVGNIGSVTTPDTGESVGKVGIIPWDEFGAYVIRAELYDVASGGDQLVRRVEEAFFQFLEEN